MHQQQFWVLLSPSSALRHPLSLSIFSLPPSLPPFIPTFPWFSGSEAVPLTCVGGQAGALGASGPTPHFIAWQTPGPIVYSTKRLLVQQTWTGPEASSAQASIFHCGAGTQRNPGLSPTVTPVSVTLAADRPRTLLAASLG